MKRVAFLTISIVVFSVSAIYTARLGWPNAGHDVNTGSEIVITLDTSQVSERVWYGTASGDVTGNLTLQTLDVPPQLFRGTWSGTTRWQVGAGTSSFTAEMRGKINTYNGALNDVRKSDRRRKRGRPCVRSGAGHFGQSTPFCRDDTC